MGHPLMPDWQNAEFDEGMATHIIRNFACFVAAEEALRFPPPVSRIRNPNGSSQRETPSEFMNRVTEHTIRYLLEMGLLEIPGDIEKRLEQYIPLQRMP